MPWVPWTTSNKPVHKKEPEPAILPLSIEHLTTASVTDVLRDRLNGLPIETLFIATFFLGATTAATGTAAYRRYFRRIPNSEWMTPDVFAKKRWIKGYVTNVGDADNFRLYHTPGFGWRWPFKFRGVPSTTKAIPSTELRAQTIHIRMAGVDAPEAAHFGRPAQPYAEEALQWLKNTVEGRTVYCQVILRDQYGRVVAIPHLRPWFLPGFLATGKCVSLEMLKAGWAEVYEQAGAEYGRWGKDEFLKLQVEAQSARRGIWEHGTNAESPSEYKRRHRALEAGQTIEDEVPSKVAPPRDESLMRRCFSRVFGR
ncbi:hypothetical protein OF83DRAFT_1162960 [Amylostereum chailletii]|nr:hypothetical protein OF83DRAFT_1162960 [Amylostereum chailletii]